MIYFLLKQFIIVTKLYACYPYILAHMLFCDVYDYMISTYRFINFSFLFVMHCKTSNMSSDSEVNTSNDTSGLSNCSSKCAGHELIDEV